MPRRSYRPIAVTLASLALAMGPTLPTTAAERRSVANGKDVFAMPRDYDFITSCDGRAGFRGDPAFGEGLVARYLFLPADPAALRQTMINLSPDPVTASTLSAEGRSYTVLTDNAVIRTHDDLIGRFHQICHYARGMTLVAIDYFRATGTEMERSPPRDVPEDATVPVDMGIGDFDFLPMPVDDGLADFDERPARYWDGSRPVVAPAFGDGLNAIFAFEGSRTTCSLCLEPLATDELSKKGFVIIAAALSGRSVTLIIDPTVLHDREALAARAKEMSALDDGGIGDGLRLARIVYYPATTDGVASLRVRSNVRDAIRRQLRQSASLRRKRLQGRAERLPDFDEVSAIVAREWARRPGDTAGSGYDVLARIGTTFGEIHDMKCTREKLVFTCRIGVTYLEDGKPKYDQDEVRFERDPDDGYKLIDQRAEDIIIT